MSIEQLRELIERLTADATQITDDELTQAREFIRAQRTHFAGQPPSEDVIVALTELKTANTAISSVTTQRAETTAELETQRQGLLTDLEDPVTAPTTSAADDTPPGTPTGTPPEPTPSDVPAVTELPTGEPTDTPVPAPLAVAASTPPARRAPIGAFKPPGTQVAVRTTTDTIMAAVTAAGGAPGYIQGQRITSTADLALAFTAQLRSMASGQGGTGEKVYVANVAFQYPESRMLRAKDWVGNFSKIEDATSPDAIVAAGGLCAPAQTLYDVQVFGSVARPILGALPAFQVDRGAIQFRPNSSAATALTTGTGTGVDVWTNPQDASPAGDLKGCYVVDCPAIQQAEVQAIYLCLEFSNVTARFDPETTAANIRQGMIAHARRAENELLRTLQNGSKVLSAVRVIGASRDILANVDKAVAYYRNRHRLDADVSLTFILPAWVLYLMRTDLARQIAAGDWMSALNVANAQIMEWFQRRGVNAVFHLDGGIGGTNQIQTVTITGAPTGGTYTLTFQGQTTSAIPWNAVAADVRAALEALSNINVGSVAVAGGPHPATAITVAFGGGQFERVAVAQMTATGSFTGGASPAVAVTTTTASSLTSVVNGVSIASQTYANAAAGATIPVYPDQIDALLFATGTKLFLDGGNLDLGLVRDSTLNSRNRYRQFSETFEGIADRGVENLRLVMTVRPTGGTAGTVDTTAIVG